MNDENDKLLDLKLGNDGLSPYNIVFYEKPNGDKPVYDFIKSQDSKMIAKILKNMDELENKGPKMTEPKVKCIGRKIYELRSQVANNETRILYFFMIAKNIVLTNGFTKKTKKTPSAEIETAERYRKDFLDRLGGESHEGN